MFEAVRPVPGLTLFSSYVSAGARSEETTPFCPFIWKNCVPLWLIFPFEVWYANVLRLRGCVLNRNARTSLIFAPSLCYRQTTRTNKKNQDGRGVKESQKQSSRSGKVYTGVSFTPLK